jgi:hypothetical protein
MFEREPFRTCPACRAADTFGFLMVARNQMITRCKACRHSSKERLPKVDKDVVYLDQLAFSEILNIGTDRHRGAPHATFWEEAGRLIQRALLLQQAIFPYSDIHFDETLVSRAPRELRDTYELLAGETSFDETDRIAMRQVQSYALAFFDGQSPILDFSVDGILCGERNVWLRDVQIGLNSDYSIFAADTRASVNRAAEAMSEIAKGWMQRKPTFEHVLREELEAYGPTRRTAMTTIAARAASSILAGDAFGYLDDMMMNPIVREHRMLRQMLAERGVSEGQIDERILACWDWPGNQSQPYHRISSYMYAATARRYAAGQKRLPTRGFLNDVKAIAAYMPYVDAMFLDNECASMLSEAPLRDDLNFKAQIFSLKSQDAFIEYLRELEGRATDDIVEYARHIYCIA